MERSSGLSSGLLLAACSLALLCTPARGEAGVERVYYVGIVEEQWDYAPSGKNLLNGKDVASDE